MTKNANTCLGSSSNFAADINSSPPPVLLLTLKRTLAGLALLAVTILLAGPGFMSRAGATELGPDKGVVPSGVLDYEDCVRIALHQSPYLARSALEIELRRLDESDSRYGMIPPLTFRTYYYVNQPPNAFGFTSKPYTLSFNMDPYNPVGSYFTLQAQKVATQMAIYAHLQSISGGLKDLGKMFLKLDSLRQMAVYQTDMIGLAKETLTYEENRQSIGTGTALELRVAAQDLELTRSELERIRHSEASTLAELKAFLGLKNARDAHFNARNARRQVLGNFDPAAASLEQAKQRSYELKVQALKEKLQSYNILLAKARVLPDILFLTQNPDPLSLTQNHGLYVAFGLQVPVWDGFKRIRNISRQKTILKQYSADKNVKEMDLGTRWHDSQAELENAALALKLAKGQEELARLKERQTEIRYQSGTVQLPDYLDARKAVLEAQKTIAQRTMDYNAMALNLRFISGDLSQSYVRPSSFEN